jgi:plasmid segregation protein ParM
MGKAITQADKAEQDANVVPLKQASADPIPVGCDDGHYGIKVVTAGDEPNTLKQTYLPSRVAEGAMIAMGDEDDTTYDCGDKTYTVSDSLQQVETRFDNYGLSDINRVLVHHALNRAGLGGKAVRLVTGLPVKDYFLGAVPNTDFIERKVKSLCEQSVTNRNQSVHLATIVQHAVRAEAIAAFFDQLINVDGSVNEPFADLVTGGKVAYCDIGGKTTDTVVIVNGGKGIDPGRSGTATIGALSLNEAVLGRLKLEFRADQLTPRQVELAIQNGKLRVFGSDRDCSEIINEEKQKLAVRIQAEARRRMGDQAADIESIFFVGGGSALLHDQLKDLYPHAHFVEDPQFANARGMFKIAKYMWKA